MDRPNIAKMLRADTTGDPESSAGFQTCRIADFQIGRLSPVRAR
jgi:hypothetical protein